MASKNSQPHWFPLEWSKQSRPLLKPSPKHFVSRNIYEPSVLFDGKTHVMMFRGESAHEPPTKRGASHREEVPQVPAASTAR